MAIELYVQVEIEDQIDVEVIVPAAGLAGIGGSVDILNQFAAVIATVPAGSTYSVEELAEICDDPDFNTTTIIDPL